MKYRSVRIGCLTSNSHPVQGQCLAGSLTGAVASQRVTEAPKGPLSPVGNRVASASAQAGLTARTTVRAGTKVGTSDPVPVYGRGIAQNLFIQMYLIKRFLFKPINEMLEKRRAAADAEITDAEAAKKEANAIKEEYEQNMQEAKAKANEILESARKTATLQSEKIVKEASEQAAALKNKAEKEIAQEKKKAVNEVKGEIGGIAMDIAGKVIEREINEKDHEKLIDEFISNVGEAS